MGLWLQYLNQMQTNGTSIQRDINFAEKAALELRGPILPSTLRGMMGAVVNFMMLDNHDKMHMAKTTPTQNRRALTVPYVIAGIRG